MRRWYLHDHAMNHALLIHMVPYGRYEHVCELSQKFNVKSFCTLICAERCISSGKGGNRSMDAGGAEDTRLLIAIEFLALYAVQNDVWCFAVE